MFLELGDPLWDLEWARQMHFFSGFGMSKAGFGMSKEHFFSFRKIFFRPAKNLRARISYYKWELIYNRKSGLRDFLPDEKIFFDMTKKCFFGFICIFHRAHAFLIPNPKDGHLTPKTQKVTTENVKKSAVSFHKADISRTHENSEITL